MCSIIGSFSKERLSVLADLNSYRGTHSHSLFVYDENRTLIYSNRSFGKLVITDHPVAEGSGRYFIAHQQAPTTEAKNTKAIHPAFMDDVVLWHNGIIKADDVKRLQEQYQTDEKWDTKLLLMHYLKTGNVDNIDGTFACFVVDDGEFRLFRNEISPLFYNDLGDISSTYFENSLSLDANKVLTFEPSFDNMFNVVAEFTTKENPYYFM